MTYPHRPPHARPQVPLAPAPKPPPATSLKIPEWTKDGEFPPVVREIPIYGTDPESGDKKLWVCRVVWQAVTAREIVMAVYGPFGTRSDSGASVFETLQKIRLQLEHLDNCNPPWRLLIKGARKDVFHVGHIVSQFPGDRAEILSAGRPVSESVDLLADVDPETEMELLGTTHDQLINSLNYFRSLDPTFASGSKH